MRGSKFPTDMHNYIWCPIYIPSFMIIGSVVSEELRWQDFGTDGRTDGRSDCTPRPSFAFGDAGKKIRHLIIATPGQWINFRREGGIAFYKHACFSHLYPPPTLFKIPWSKLWILHVSASLHRSRQFHCHLLSLISCLAYAVLINSQYQQPFIPRTCHLQQSLALLKKFLNGKYLPLEKGIIWGGGTNNDKILIWLSNLSQNLQALKTDIPTTLTFMINLLEIGPEVLEKRTKC